METFVKSVSEVKSMPEETIMKDMIKVKILDRSQQTSYTSSKGQAGTLFNCTLADSTGSIRGVVYDGSRMSSFAVDSDVLLVDVIVKDGYIAITKQTQVWPQAGSMSIPQEVRDEAQQVLCGNKKEVNVVDAAISPKKEVIGQLMGRVYKVGRLETRHTRLDKESVLFRKVKVLDSTGKIPLCLWRDMAETNLSRGDNIAVHNFTVTDTFDKNQKSVPALTNKLQSSSIEFLPESTCNITLSDASSEEDEGPPAGQVIGICDLTSYKSCRNSSCYNRKLVDMRCANCGMTYRETGIGTGYLGKLLMVTNTGPKRFTFFKQQLLMIKEKFNITSEAASELQVEIMARIPFHCTYTARGDKLNRIDIVN